MKTDTKLFSTLDRINLIFDMAYTYKEKYDPDRPTPKTDLTYAELHKLLFSSDVTKSKFIKLISEDKINARIKLSKWSNELLAIFKDDFKGIERVETRDDIRIILSTVYEEWYKLNNPDYTKRITSSRITIPRFLDMLRFTKKDTNILNDLYNAGMLSLSWRLSHLSMEALIILQNALK